MKTRYRALTKRGEWIIISSKKPLRNVKLASEVAKEEIIEVNLYVSYKWSRLHEQMTIPRPALSIKDLKFGFTSKIYAVCLR